MYFSSARLDRAMFEYKVSRLGAAGPMRGVMFNLLESFILENWGEEAYERALDRCGEAASGPFIGVLDYSDALFMAQLEATSKQLDATIPDTLLAFGRWCVPRLAVRFPSAVQGKADAHACAVGLPDFVALELRKLDPFAGPAPIDVAEAEDELVLRFIMGRSLCRLVEGLLVGLAGHFHQRAHVEHAACVAECSPCCELRVRFEATLEDVA